MPGLFFFTVVSHNVAKVLRTNYVLGFGATSGSYHW